MREKYDVIVVNFANPDMVGHTGVLEAAVKAAETAGAMVAMPPCVSTFFADLPEVPIALSWRVIWSSMILAGTPGSVTRTSWSWRTASRAWYTSPR